MPKNIIKVANYFDDFKCKCGNCRNSCCSGWGVTITFNEYCMLLGINCKKKLREKIDCGIVILDNPSKERYAKINHNWLGKCYLQDENGYCMIHKMLGEKYLPLICRMYPRNFSINSLGEGAISNSCEKTLELLFSNTDKLELVERTVDFDYSPAFVKLDDKEVILFKKIQQQSIELLSDRRYSLKHRFTNLSRFIDSIFSCQMDYDKIEKILSDHINSNIDYEDYSKVDMDKTISILINLIETICTISPGFKEYAYKAKTNYETLFSKNINENYELFKKQFINTYKNSEIYLEKLIVNHLLFEMFPLSLENGSNILKEFMSLCGVYSLTKFIVIGFSKTAKNSEEIIDTIAKLYKFFEHFNADNIIVSVLEDMNINNLENLICITDI